MRLWKRLCSVLLMSSAVGFEPPHKAAVIPGAAELSVARVYIRCAPAHSDISVGTHISVGLHLGKLPGATPCYSPHKSVGTRSGVVPGAPVGVLASWDIGAPRSDRQALPEKRGTDLVLRQVLAWQKSPFLYCHRKGTSAFQHPRFTRSVDLPAYSARDEGGTTSLLQPRSPMLILSSCILVLLRSPRIFCVPNRIRCDRHLLR